MRALISTRILNFRGGILEQLAAGIRLLELDVHNFTIGHGFPCEGAPQYGLTIEACEAERPCHGAGCEVDHGDPETDTEGNPTTNTLVDWLHQVSVWSAQHPTHSPITICLDIKEVYGPWLGFGPWLGALDTMVRKEFSSIYTPAELAVHREAQGTAWPLVETMRGKVPHLRTPPPPLTFSMQASPTVHTPLQQPHILVCTAKCLTPPRTLPSHTIGPFCTEWRHDDPRGQPGSVLRVRQRHVLRVPAGRPGCAQGGDHLPPCQPHPISSVHTSPPTLYPLCPYPLYAYPLPCARPPCASPRASSARRRTISSQPRRRRAGTAYTTTSSAFSCARAPSGCAAVSERATDPSRSSTPAHSFLAAATAPL